MEEFNRKDLVNAVRQVLMGDLGLSRDDLVAMARDIVEKKANAYFENMVLTPEKIIERAVSSVLTSKYDRYYRGDLSGIVLKEAKRQTMERIAELLKDQLKFDGKLQIFLSDK